MSDHPKACVCAECCDRRGGKRAADVKVSRPVRQPPNLGKLGRDVSAAGWRVTRLVYGTFACLLLLALLYALARG